MFRRHMETGTQASKHRAGNLSGSSHSDTSQSDLDGAESKRNLFCVMISDLPTFKNLFPLGDFFQSDSYMTAVRLLFREEVLAGGHRTPIKKDKEVAIST